MNVISDKYEMIFRKDYQGRALYSLGISKKKQDGKYENGYISCQFPKNVDLPNKSMIKIKKAWLDFYNKENNGKITTVPYVFIYEFELEQKKEIVPYSAMGEQIVISDDDYPF